MINKPCGYVDKARTRTERDIFTESGNDKLLTTISYMRWFSTPGRLFPLIPTDRENCSHRVKINQRSFHEDINIATLIFDPAKS